MEKCGANEFIDKHGKKCIDKCENVKSLTNTKCLDTCPIDSTANSTTKVCECDQTKPFINVAGDKCLAKCPEGFEDANNDKQCDGEFIFGNQAHYTEKTLNKIAISFDKIFAE